jgi:hypothetical protein
LRNGGVGAPRASFGGPLRRDAGASEGERQDLTLGRCNPHSPDVSEAILPLISPLVHQPAQSPAKTGALHDRSFGQIRLAPHSTSQRVPPLHVMGPSQPSLPLQSTLQAAPDVQDNSSPQVNGPLHAMLQSESEVQLTFVGQEPPAQSIVQGAPSLRHSTTPAQPSSQEISHGPPRVVQPVPKGQLRLPQWSWQLCVLPFASPHAANSQLSLSQSMAQVSARQRAPAKQEPAPVQSTVQVLNSGPAVPQATLPAQLAVPLQITVQSLCAPSQSTPPAHESPPLHTELPPARSRRGAEQLFAPRQWTSQDGPSAGHSMAVPPQELSPSQLKRRSVGTPANAKDPLHDLSPSHSISQGAPAAQLTAALQVSWPVQTTSQLAPAGQRIGCVQTPSSRHSTRHAKPSGHATGPLSQMLSPAAQMKTHVVPWHCPPAVSQVLAAQPVGGGIDGGVAVSNPASPPGLLRASTAPLEPPSEPSFAPAASSFEAPAVPDDADAPEPSFAPAASSFEAPAVPDDADAPAPPGEAAPSVPAPPRSVSSVTPGVRPSRAQAEAMCSARHESTRQLITAAIR